VNVTRSRTPGGSAVSLGRPAHLAGKRDPEGEPAGSVLRLFFRPGCVSFRPRGSMEALGSLAGERHEGTGVGDGVRLHERGKALEGEPQERIWPETRPAGTGWSKASGGCENLETQGVRGVEPPDTPQPLPRARIRCRGTNLMGGAAVA
jgi:hypothetical protein